jgi:hypothetical protein
MQFPDLKNTIFPKLFETRAFVCPGDRIGSTKRISIYEIILEVYDLAQTAL